MLRCDTLKTGRNTCMNMSKSWDKQDMIITATPFILMLKLERLFWQPIANATYIAPFFSTPRFVKVWNFPGKGHHVHRLFVDNRPSTLSYVLQECFYTVLLTTLKPCALQSQSKSKILLIYSCHLGWTLCCSLFAKLWLIRRRWHGCWALKFLCIHEKVEWNESLSAF